MFPQHPHTTRCGHSATLRWNTSLWGFTGCGIGSVQGSLYIHLLSLLPWQGKEELCLQNLHCSHFPPLPSRLMVAMETSRMSMTALCVRYAGRGDVMCFSPPLWLSLCCVRGTQLQHHWVPGFAAHVDACANAQATRCYREAGEGAPASGMNSNPEWGVNC